MKIKLLKKTEWAGHEFEFAPGYTFTLDHACRDYDWLVVYDEMPCEEKLCCPWQHTILATQEPVSVKSYSQAGAVGAQIGLHHIDEDVLAVHLGAAQRQIAQIVGHMVGGKIVDGGVKIPVVVMES